jgi:putative membrane protein
MNLISKYLPHILLAVYAIEFAVLSINPYARDVWFVENMTVLVIVIALVIMYAKGIRFSNTAYVLMFILPFMHTIGGHFTFEKVPFDWFNDMFGFERNMYDRVAHATVGLYAFPLAEYVLAKKKVASAFWATFLSLCFIVSVAAFYELFEWQYAINADPTAGIAVLGAQGDIWDAQKDMLMDTLGAVTALVIFNVRRMFLK